MKRSRTLALKKAAAAALSVTAATCLVVSRAHSQKPLPGTVVLAQSGIYTLSQIAQMTRDQSGYPVYVDARGSGRRVYVSQGDYAGISLIAAVRKATRLNLKSVGATRLLTPSDKTDAVDRPIPLLPGALVDRLGHDLRDLAYGAPLQREGVPFPADAFLDRKEYSFDKLTRDQQVFVAKACHFIVQGPDAGSRGLAALSMDDAPLAAGIAGLKGTTVRLGASDLLILRAAIPAKAGEEHDNQAALVVRQVYYDYRADFPVLLPEDD